MFVVDTNLLIYAATRQSPEHQRALSLVDQWRKGDEQFFATWPIVYEFLRLTTHPGAWSRPISFQDAWSFVQSLLRSPRFGLLVETDRHAGVFDDLARQYPRLAGNIFHDFHTVVLMKEHGITEIRSADMDFHRFGFLRAVNPLQ